MHLNQIWKSTGKMPDELEPPFFPTIIVHVWDWYKELHNVRPNTGMGNAPVQYSEIYAWAALTRVQPTPWEVQLIARLDAEFLIVTAEKVR